MSVAMGSGTDLTLVYVKLLGEGTEVYRPVQGEPCGPGLVRLLVPDDYDPEDEDWEFKPGATVRIKARTLSEGELFVAVEPT